MKVHGVAVAAGVVLLGSLGLAAPANGSTTRHVEGTYEGVEHYAPSSGRCPVLDHELDLRFELGEDRTWVYHSDYCGSIEGSLFTGAGTFTITVPGGATITGDFTESVELPTTGDPIELGITGGTKRFKRASGSCTLDNHLLPRESGVQEHFGTFECDIDR